MSEDDIEFEHIHSPRRRTGTLYPPGHEPEIKPYVSPLERQREQYWSGLVVGEKRGLLQRLFTKKHTR